MVKATPAPKLQYPALRALPYAYAVILAVLAAVQLVGVGGFSFAGIDYQTSGAPGMIVAIAGMEIFALPFLLRLPLSLLARFLSALFGLVAPLFIVVNLVYMTAESMTPTNWYAVTAGVLLVALGTASFLTLGGNRALRFSKK